MVIIQERDDVVYIKVVVIEIMRSDEILDML